MGLIEGAGIALVFFLLGRLVPGRRTRPKPPKPVQAICGCEHHHSFHEPDTGKCRFTWQEYLGNSKYKQLTCPCVHYSGPEPLPEYVPREIAGA